jgi:hypothetical protein
MGSFCSVNDSQNALVAALVRRSRVILGRVQSQREAERRSAGSQTSTGRPISTPLLCKQVTPILSTSAVIARRGRLTLLVGREFAIVAPTVSFQAIPILYGLRRYGPRMNACSRKAWGRDRN